LAEAGTTEFRVQRQADMRYVGQGFEINVPVPEGPLGPHTLEALQASFYESYQTLFGRRVTSVPIEALSWRLTAQGNTPDVGLNFANRADVRGPAKKGTRKAHFPDTGFVPCDVYNRYALQPGDKIAGPAIIEEREATVVIGPDASATIDAHFNLVMEIDVAASANAGRRSSELVHNS
jgi:N-methylhydantoinase A